MDFATNSIIGKRENQEDYGVIKFVTSTDGVLAVISDGMGGQVAGEVASSTVVDSFSGSFISGKSKNLPLRLKVALEKANQNLAKSVKTNPKLNGMGATLIAVHINPQGMLWTSVGDSILYLYRHGKITRLNEDHSMAPVLKESVRKGQISEAEAKAHPHRNALRSALTGEEITMIDLTDQNYQLQNGDIVLLATDGLLTLSVSEVCTIINKFKTHSANEIVERLLQAVSAAGKPKQDNTLIQAIKVSGNKKGNFSLLGIIASVLIVVISLGALIFYFDAAKVSFSNSLLFKDKPTPKPVEQVEIKPTPIDSPPSEPAPNSSASVVVGQEVSPPSKKPPIPTEPEKPETKADKKSTATNKVSKPKEVGGTGNKIYIKPGSSEDSQTKNESKSTPNQASDSSKTVNTENVINVPAVKDETKLKTEIINLHKESKVESAAPEKPTSEAPEIEKQKVIPVEDRSINKKSE
jgi:protein phosphatase